jgi:hypothetical protein
MTRTACELLLGALIMGTPSNEVDATPKSWSSSASMAETCAGLVGSRFYKTVSAKIRG